MSLRGRADAVSGRRDSMRTELLGPCAASGTEFLIKFSTVIVDCAVRLHQELGPGLMESVYEFTLARRLEQRGLHVERQAAIPIEIDGLRFDEGFRAAPRRLTSPARIRSVAACAARRRAR